MAFTPVSSLWRWNGVTVKMKFTVNKKGEAVHIRSAVPLSNLDRKQRDVAAAMTDALRYWRFPAARDSNGQLVPAEIVLPITFVSG